MNSKEIARQAGLSGCKKYGLQFLDDTVSLRKLRIVRNRNGRIGFARKYSFEFSSDGSARYSGHLWIVDEQILDFVMDPYPEPEPQLPPG